MSQIKIFGLRSQLFPIRQKLSDLLHSCVVEAFNLPVDKRFHRFIYLEEDSFFYPSDRSEKYTIIEISLFEGRSIESRKKLYQLVFEIFEKELEIMPIDVEITLFETPKHNWGIRGKPGDELTLSYKVNV